MRSRPVRAPPAPVVVRPALPRDREAVRSIYNDAVATTTATFDTEPRSVAADRAWWSAHRAPYLVLVAVDARGVVGWASLSAWSERRAYAATAEVSEYVAAGHRGRGVGRALLGRLVGEADRRGFHTLLARIAEGNPASQRLHRAFGFRPVGVMREVGVKFGRRIDVHLLQRLGPRRPAPGRAARRAPGSGRTRSPRGNRPL